MKTRPLTMNSVSGRVFVSLTLFFTLPLSYAPCLFMFIHALSCVHCAVPGAIDLWLLAK